MEISKKIKSYMVEWTINYLKNKDLFAKNIVSIERHNDELCVKFKKGEQFYLMLPTIHDVDELIQKIREKRNLAVIVLNSKENFQLITQNWKRFIDFEQFTIFFINPFSNLDRKWILCPYVHNKICDDASLVNGLKSIFSTVEMITEEQLHNLISDTRK